MSVEPRKIGEATLSSATVAAPLPRFVPDADRGMIYEFAMDRCLDLKWATSCAPCTRSTASVLRYKRNGRVLAVASIFRDVESLEAELTMERSEQR
jgi:hypothetical protein